MGQGKISNYRKVLKEFEELKYRQRYLYAERVTAVYGGPTSTGEWTPAVDLYETRDSFYLVAEVAGVQQSDISLGVAGNIVTLKGVRPFEREGAAPDQYVRMEVPFGSFERSFTLPCAVSESEVEAVLRDGVLTVKLPRHDAAARREVKINSSRV